MHIDYSFPSTLERSNIPFLMQAVRFQSSVLRCSNLCRGVRNYVVLSFNPCGCLTALPLGTGQTQSRLAEQLAFAYPGLAWVAL